MSFKPIFTLKASEDFCRQVWARNICFAEFRFSKNLCLWRFYSEVY